MAAGGFANGKALVASTAVNPDDWRTLIHPRPAGWRHFTNATLATDE